MKTRSDEVAQRVRLYRDILLSHLDEQGDTPLFFKEIATREQAEFQKRPTERQITYALELCRDEIGSGKSLSISKKEKLVRINDAGETIFERRMRNAKREKIAIGTVLWNWLFDFDLLNESYRPSPSWEKFKKSTSSLEVGKRLENKRRVLRNRSNLSMVVDAGSTNYLVIREFLRQEKFPFTIDVEEGGERFKRLVNPIIVTNSIPMADLIERHPMRRSMTLRLIGGTARADRRSICGTLALSWLRMCFNEGNIVSSDISIVGSTGYDNSIYDVPSAGCDDAHENALKARLLDLGKFRVITMDSSKIVSASTTSQFAAITRANVDMLVIDDGSRHDLQGEIKRLCEEAQSNGVGVLIAEYDKGFKKV